MSKSTISTFQLFKMFPDQETARVYLESRLWPNRVRCPVCGLGERITTRKGGFYRCNQCKEDFTVRTGTVFERSHVPLHKWIYAMYLVVTARKGSRRCSSPRRSASHKRRPGSFWAGCAKRAARTSRS
jgi:transposase-like protein